MLDFEMSYSIEEGRTSSRSITANFPNGSISTNLNPSNSASVTASSPPYHVLPNEHFETYPLDHVATPSRPTWCDMAPKMTSTPRSPRDESPGVPFTNDLCEANNKLSMGSVREIIHNVPDEPSAYQHSPGKALKKHETISQGCQSQSQWLKVLGTRGILTGPKNEFDWSGKGQHVEYDTEEEIPLKVEHVLGSSSTAIVDSVRCQGVWLARKRIRCNRRLTKEAAISEVENILRLPHMHIIRVVGTYTLRNDLAILLYPVAQWTLAEFMDDILESDSRTILQDHHGVGHFCSDVTPGNTHMNVKLHQPRRRALIVFFGCLANGLCFIHSKNVKHKDIKPQNLLVRQISEFSYRIYIADFGIARAYKSAEDSETDSPTLFTRLYAAPEVLLQVRRGMSADIFSLGCVFIEMLATLLASPDRNEREKLQRQPGSNKHMGSSFNTDIDNIKAWYQRVHSTLVDRQYLGYDFGRFQAEFFILLPRMIHQSAAERPSAADVKKHTANLQCRNCDDGCEPFEPIETIP